MKIPLAGLGPEGASFEGEDPVETLAWEPSPRDVVHAAGPMRWRVRAQLFGPELVCTGRAEALFEGTCCRCGGPLSRVWGDDFAVSRQVSEDETEADLTSEVRETILLALPNHPACSDGCPGPSRTAAAPETAAPSPAADPWSVLDSLSKSPSGGKTHENKRPRPKKTPNTKTR